MDIDGFFQADQQPLSVEPNRQNVAGVAVITDLSAFLEMVDVHLPRFCVTDHYNQAAGEEALHDIHVRDFIASMDLVKLLHRTQRKQLVTGLGSNR